jgi:predicted N-acyltransferase
MTGRPGALFTRPDYLDPLEQSGCAGPERGWVRVPLEGAEAVPVYAKSHSWGEFVFDFEIAAAYRGHGLRYYPKLVCCVPFTPVPGPRLFAGEASAARHAAAALESGGRTHSSAHVLFCTEDEAALLRDRGWIGRLQFRYAWHDRGYAGFDAFLEALPGKRRKNIRRERKAVAATGLHIAWRAGSTFDDEEWTRIHALYASTYEMRGQQPYFDARCLRAWAQSFGEAMPFCVASKAGQIVAMAFFFRDETTLYGRHWGSAVDVKGLHFELCYYQGIDYALRHRLTRFDAGVQGEHRLLRGFEPEFSYSAHWFAHEAFRGAIARAFDQETAALGARMRHLRERYAAADDEGV